MKRYGYYAFLVTILLTLWGGIPASAQGDGPAANEKRYYPQTGHWVVGDFLNKYESASDPLLIYGYPITEVFWDETTERHIQYFEKARFEFIPEALPELRVKISDLGKFLYEPGYELKTPENFPACRYFPETKKRVCYAFLDFFDANGGAAQFGYPISNFELHGHRIVQYFNFARIEWHPQNPPGERVRLADLGLEYFYTIREDPRRLDPFPITQGSDMPISVLELNIRAYPAKPFVTPNGEQTLYIAVKDQNLIPVEGVEVTVEIKLPSGQTNRIIVPVQSDKNGIIQHTFQFRNQPPGMVEVLVTATKDSLRQTTRTSFRVWR